MTQRHAGARPPYAFAILGLAMMLSLQVHAAPTGGVVAAGTAGIASVGSRTTITQTSQNAVINWQGFGIAAGESVNFVQPGSNSVALNRVLGPDPSAIFGNLSANGKVFLVNSAGVLFGAGASVNVGGLVASTLNIGDADFMAGRYEFTGSGRGTVSNQGTINAPGGYVALLGSEVSNDGVISARLGSVALAGGQAMRLDVLGDNLLQVTVSRAAVDALVRNGGLIQADGGQVLLTTQAAGSLLSTAVNNTGVIQAQTISVHKGSIKLMGTMEAGTMEVSGRLDASAPNGGDGGFIETSAARVQVRDGAQVTTLAASGRSGEWLIDPLDFVIGPGGNMGAADVVNALGAGNLTIDTTAMPGAGNGDITVDSTVAVAWGGSTTLTLKAAGKVTINGTITPTLGNLVVCCGNDIEVNGTITTDGGSVLLASSGKVDLNLGSTVTLTDGNLMICAANDINMAGTITLTRGTSIAALSLGLPVGMTLKAGLGGTVSGLGGGTLVFAPTAATTVNTASVLVQYSPPDFNTAPTDFSTNFNPGVPITQQRLVFANSAPKSAGGTTGTILTGLRGGPLNVALSAPGPGSVANFETTTAGPNQAITFTGYTLVGADAALYALPELCCGPMAGSNSTTAPIGAAVLPPGGGGGGLGGGLGGGGLPVVLGPEGDSPFADSDSGGLSSFAPFLASPWLLKGPAPLLTVAPVAPLPMQMVLVQAPAFPAAVTAAPEAAAAAPQAAPVAPAAAPAAAPYRAPARPARPYRN